MPDEPDEGYRIVVDESSFDFRSIEDATLSNLLDELSDALEVLQASHTVAASPGWGEVECREGLLLAQFLYDRAQSSVSPSVLVRLARHIDKCRGWEDVDDPTGPVEIDTRSVDIAWSVHYALHRTFVGKSVACLGLSTSERRGWLRVCCHEAAAETEVYFFAAADELPQFWRGLYEREDIPEHRFLELADLAFPELVLAPGLKFRKFDGSYAEMREWVVRALCAINDEFPSAMSRNSGQPQAVQAALGHLGLDLSPESPRTRANARVMKLRDIEHEGVTYRCEWHAKKEPHHNRIHFSLPATTLGGKILIGIFIDHLPT